MIQEIPTFKVQIDHKDRVNKLIKQYNDIIGQRLCNTTITEMCILIRLLNQEKISPLLYFTWFITAIPKDEYITAYQLNTFNTNNLLTMPISILNIIENVIQQPGSINPIKNMNILFDPFNIDWQSWEEYDVIMKVIEDNHLDDIRYDYYITILWHT